MVQSERHRCSGMRGISRRRDAPAETRPPIVISRFHLLAFAILLAYVESSSSTPRKNIVGPRRAAVADVSHRDNSIRVDRSYAFYLEPRAVVKSVLSKVGEDLRAAAAAGEKVADWRSETVLQIDVSSSRLGDADVLALMEGLPSALRLTEKNGVISSEEESGNGNRSVILLRLAMRMNRLTSAGAANILFFLHKEAHQRRQKTAESDGIEKEEGDTILGDVNATSTDADGSDENKDTEEITDKPAEDEESKDGQSEQEMGIGDPSNRRSENPSSALNINELDLSFNDIGGHGTHPVNAHLLQALRKLFEGVSVGPPNTEESMIPRVLVLENCEIGPAVCRAIGRGILDGVESKISQRGSGPAVLRLAGNHAIGDAGTVALAAAFRLAVVPTPPSQSDPKDGDNRVVRSVAATASQPRPLLEELDLSSCDVGDAGAEALALALVSNPGCLEQLDLSNNKLTDEGVEAIGRALTEAHRTREAFRARAPSVDTSSSGGFILDRIVLDNNVGVGDRGAVALADAVARGAVRSVSMRSCSIRAGGAAAFGKALVSIATKDRGRVMDELGIDLSGNRLGTVKVEKKKKGAAFIRSKASSHMNFMSKTIRSRLKDAGKGLGVTAESDDDEEDLDEAEADAEVIASQASASKCGARSFCDEVLRLDGKNEKSNLLEKDAALHGDERSTRKCILGLRRCYLETSATDALSASVIAAEKLGMDLSIDVSLNTGISDTAIGTLRGDAETRKMLREMAARHAEALQVVRQAQQRAALAAEAAAARKNAEMEMNGAMFGEDDFGISDDFGYDPYDDY